MVFILHGMPSTPSVAPLTFDFYISPSGGTGAGTIGDPWSIAYATGSGAGTAQGDSKLPTSGARIGCLGGAYNRNASTLVWKAHGSIGPGVDSPTGKLIWQAVPGQRPNFHLIDTAATPAGVDGFYFDTGADYNWLIGIEVDAAYSTRVTATQGGQLISTFQTSAAVQGAIGLKLIECVIHDGCGGTFCEFDCGRMEIYGCIYYNQGWNDTGGDGGGHHIYIHHKGPSILTVESCIFFQDEGVGLQAYTTTGGHAWEEYIDLINNIQFNSGSLNSQANNGGVDATAYVIGGLTSANAHMNHINVTGNHNFFSDAGGGHGDRALQIAQGGAQLIGPAISVTGNYFYGGGSGWGQIDAHSILASGGTLTLTGNTQRVKQDYGANHRLLALGENNASGGYTISGNIYYRKAGAGEPPILAFKDGTGSFRTLANFNADLGVTAGTLADDPVVTEAYVIRADRYTPGRAHCVYYNYASLARIPFNLSPTLSPGNAFTVKDPRDFYGTAVDVYDAPTGGNVVTTYTGATVYFPTTQKTNPVMVGSNWGVGSETAPPDTAPFFNTFVVQKV